MKWCVMLIARSYSVPSVVCITVSLVLVNCLGETNLIFFQTSRFEKACGMRFYFLV